jgi:hypothetical protein
LVPPTPQPRPTPPAAAEPAADPNAPVPRQRVVDYWRSKGVSDHVAEGIADALHGESGLRPLAVNPTSGATGLAQDLGPRKTALTSQPDWQNPQVQLDNMYREVTGGDPESTANWDKIKNAPTREAARQLWSQHFERPGPTGAPKTEGAGWRISPTALSSAQATPNTDVRWMSPADYLALTPDLDETAPTAQRRSLSKSLAAGEDIQELPALDVAAKDGKLRVTDQDGRNRARAAQQAGVDLIPVAIKGVPRGGQFSEIVGMRPDAQPRKYDFAVAPVSHPWEAYAPPQSPGASETPGFWEGARSIVGGAAKLAEQALPTGVSSAINRLNNTLSEAGLPLARVPEGGVSQMEEERQQALERQRGPQPTWGEVAGETAATLPLMALGGGIPGVVAAGALSGAAAPTSGPDYWSQVGQNALVGAGTALGLRQVGQALGRAIAPEFRKAVDTLLQHGVNLTPGMLGGQFGRVMESVGRSIPPLSLAIEHGRRQAIESLNRAVWNRVLEPLGEKLPDHIAVGRDAADWVGKVIQDGYSKVIPHLSWDNAARDARVFFNDVHDVARRAQANLPDQQFKVFGNIIKDQVVGKLARPNVDGETLNGIDQMLGSEATGYRHDPSFDNRKLGVHLNEVQLGFRTAIEKMSGEAGRGLRDLRGAYANYVRAARASAAPGAKEGVFGPGQLKTAVRQSDPSLRKMDYGKGHALLQDLSDAADAVLPSVVPDSGTPLRGLAIGTLAGGLKGLYAPHVLGAELAAMPLYTSPGMSLLRNYATVAPVIRNHLAQIPKLGARAVAPGLSFEMARP